jgi:Na+/H+-translocating membrane pyrophosphatase
MIDPVLLGILIGVAVVFITSALVMFAAASNDGTAVETIEEANDRLMEKRKKYDYWRGKI